MYFALCELGSNIFVTPRAASRWRRLFNWPDYCVIHCYAPGSCIYALSITEFSRISILYCIQVFYTCGAPCYSFRSVTFKHTVQVDRSDKSHTNIVVIRGTIVRLWGKSYSPGLYACPFRISACLILFKSYFGKVMRLVKLIVHYQFSTLRSDDCNSECWFCRRTGIAQVKAVYTVFKEEKSNLFVMDNKHSKRVYSWIEVSFLTGSRNAYCNISISLHETDILVCRLSFTKMCNLFHLTLKLITLSGFTTQPMSAKAPLGGTALFTCAGEGFALFWTINGQPHLFPASKERGVKVMYEDANAPVFRSSLTIPGITENNNVSIQCALVLGSKLVYSPAVFLTVYGKLCVVDK